jgi:hypothetical protein
LSVSSARWKSPIGGSNAPFPPLWIAASVKTRDHYQGTNFDAEEKSVREFTQTCTMHISKNDRELVGVPPQTEDSSFNFFAKTHSKAGMPGFVPILSV